MTPATPKKKNPPKTVRAALRHLRVAPRKVRLVLDLVRGLAVPDALDQLKHSDKRVAQPLLKLLKSAVANAENATDETARADRAQLYIRSFSAGEGPTLKRYRPRAYGRASMIRKRSSHVTLVLEEKKQPVAGDTQPKTETPSSSATPTPATTRRAVRDGQQGAKSTQKQSTPATPKAKS